jgi:hypothetical protein
MRLPEPEWDTVLWLAWATAPFFFLVFIVSAIGELLDWWDLVGEIGMGVGATVSMLVTLGALAALPGVCRSKSSPRRSVPSARTSGRSAGTSGPWTRTFGRSTRTCKRFTAPWRTTAKSSTGSR